MSIISSVLFCWTGGFCQKLLIFRKIEHWLAGKLEWKRLMSKVSLQVSKKLVRDNLVHLQYEMLIKRLILHENWEIRKFRQNACSVSFFVSKNSRENSWNAYKLFLKKYFRFPDYAGNRISNIDKQAIWKVAIVFD